MGLLCIMVVGAAIRVPGITWLQDATPHAEFSLHPDEQRFIIWAAKFEEKPRFHYFQGMTAHIYAINKLAHLAFNAEANLVLIARFVSLAYGFLLLGLIGVVVRTLTSSAELGLLSAAFLAFAPAHVISSHFGTVDSASAFYFLLAAFLGWWYAKTRSETTLVLLAAATGVCLGMKFILPILAPLALVLIAGREKIKRDFLASLVFALSFFAVNFFSLTPWDFVRSIRQNIYDALIAETWCSAGGSGVIDGCGPVVNMIYYFHGALSGLGIPAALLAMAGTLIGAVKLSRHLRDRFDSSHARYVGGAISELTRHPLMVFASPFLLTLFLIMTMDLRAVRFALPLIPMLCFAAAVGLGFFLARAGSRLTVIGALGAVFGYAAFNAVGVEYVFRHDIRNEVALWIEDHVKETESVTSFRPYSTVKGVTLIVGEDYERSDVTSEYFVTCDLEYERYIERDRAEDIFHARGGQVRVNFYHELFANERGYAPVKTFQGATFTPEQDLIARGLLVPLDTYTPERCIVFKRSTGSPRDDGPPRRRQPSGS